MSAKRVFPGSYDDIEEIAGELRRLVDREFHNNGEAVSDLLHSTAKRLGGRIEVAEKPTHRELEGASLVIRKAGDFTIFLSPYTSPLRDNFTIAHELGHYLLHYNRKESHHGQTIVFYRYGSDEYEWQANRFAAAFLMPKEEFSKIYNELNGNTGLIAGHFQVSEPAVRVRAEYALSSQS